MKQLGYYVLAAFLLTACQSYKKVPYLQDAEVVLYSTQDAQLYDAKIMPTPADYCGIMYKSRTGSTFQPNSGYAE